MVRKTMKMLVVALVAAFALSSMAEAAAPKKTVRHRTKHSSAGGVRRRLDHDQTAQAAKENREETRSRPPRTHGGPKLAKKAPAKNARRSKPR